jgi:hypothetical protein
MDITSVAGSSLLMQNSQSQQAMSISMIKQAANQQNRMANLLAQSAQQAPQPTGGAEFSFSTYA